MKQRRGENIRYFLQPISVIPDVGETHMIDQCHSVTSLEITLIIMLIFFCSFLYSCNILYTCTVLTINMLNMQGPMYIMKSILRLMILQYLRYTVFVKYQVRNLDQILFYVWQNPFDFLASQNQCHFQGVVNKCTVDYVYVVWDALF